MNIFDGKIIRYSQTEDRFYLGESTGGASFAWDAPLSIGWLITGKCNLRCIHCYGNEEELPENEISPEQAMIIARKIVSEGIRRVSFSGGEPMLRKDLPDIVEYLGDNGVGVIISTNGLSVDENQSKLKKLRHIEFSLDGPDEKIHDFIRPSRKAGGRSFRNAIDAMISAKRMGLKIRVLTTLNIHNFRCLPEIGAVLEGIGVDEWHIGRTTHAGRARFIYSRLMDGVRFDESELASLQKAFPRLKIQYNYPSKASKYYALILPDGQMTTQDYVTGEKIPLGTLHESKGFRDYWNQENYDVAGHYAKWLNMRTEII